MNKSYLSTKEKQTFEYAITNNKILFFNFVKLKVNEQTFSNMRSMVTTNFSSLSSSTVSTCFMSSSNFCGANLFNTERISLCTVWINNNYLKYLNFHIDFLCRKYSVQCFHKTATNSWITLSNFIFTATLK